MKETSQQFVVVKGRFLDKEKFIYEHPELKGYVYSLPDNGYFEDKEGKVIYHLDMGLTATTDLEDCRHLPKIVKDMLQHLRGEMAKARKEIPS